MVEAALLLVAARVFDGIDIHSDAGVVLKGETICATASPPLVTSAAPCSRPRAATESFGGAALSLAAGVDEWAHVPCAEVDPEILRQAVHQGIEVVTTLDTLSHCPGVRTNAMQLARLGASFLYGAEIAHPDVPWGIDAQELQLAQHLTGLSPIELFRAATSQAGTYLGLAPLGTLGPGAPADIIAVRGNPFENFKLLEYPDLVVSGGRFVVDEFPE
jgi:imidazolonepropionase-like amidohydrolase